MCHKTMITVLVSEFNTLSQVFYDKVVNVLPLHEITCSCGCTGKLIRYGHYRRCVKTGDCNTDKISLSVQRLLCTECGHTHAILLYLLVPYSQIPLEDMVSIIRCVEDGSSFRFILERTPSIDEANAGYIIRTYFRHWKIRFSLTAATTDIAHIVRYCFRHFSQQFMQNHIMRNVLFSFSPT